MTLLVAPMSGFYNQKEGLLNPGDTQLRLSFCETVEKSEHIPYLLHELLKNYEANRLIESY